MTGKMKIIIPALILIAGVVIMMLLTSLGGKKQKKVDISQTKVVDTKIVQLSSIPATVTGYGRISSTQPIQLFSEVAGILEAGDIPFQPAQSFKKGDLLLRVDNRQATLALKSVKSDLMTALAIFLAEIKTNFPDQFDLWQQYFNGCSFDGYLQELPEVTNPKIKLFLSRFNVYKLYFTARDLEIRLSKHYFYAPFDGSIISCSQRVGSTARNGTLLGKIINLEKLEIEVPVSVQDIKWIDNNASVLLYSAEMAGQWLGKINRIGEAIDTRTQTVQVFITVDEKAQLPVIEGIFFEAEIAGFDIDNAVSIPRKALYNNNYVYLIKDEKLVYQKVDVARIENGSVIIIGGLSDGDTLVIEAMQGVFEDMPAKPKMIQTNTGADVDE